MFAGPNGSGKTTVKSGLHRPPEWFGVYINPDYRSLSLLHEAIRHTNRAYFFDTSEATSWFFAEAKEGTSIELKSDEMPDWFQPIWDQFVPLK